MTLGGGLGIGWSSISVAFGPEHWIRVTIIAELICYSFSTFCNVWCLNLCKFGIIFVLILTFSKQQLLDRFLKLDYWRKNFVPVRSLRLSFFFFNKQISKQTGMTAWAFLVPHTEDYLAIFVRQQSDVNLCSVLPWLVFILHELKYNNSIEFVLQNDALSYFRKLQHWPCLLTFPLGKPWTLHFF